MTELRENQPKHEAEMIFCCRSEPTLAEILSDPITLAVMQADAVDPAQLAAVLRKVADARREAPRASRGDCRSRL
jgi:hypothetical protein